MGERARAARGWQGGVICAAGVALAAVSLAAGIVGAADTAAADRERATAAAALVDDTPVVM